MDAWTEGYGRHRSMIANFFFTFSREKLSSNCEGVTTTHCQLIVKNA